MNFQEASSRARASSCGGLVPTSMFIVSLMISDSVADNMSTHSNFSLYVRYLPGLKGRSSSGAIMGKWMPVAIKQVDFPAKLEGLVAAWPGCCVNVHTARGSKNGADKPNHRLATTVA